MAENGAVLTPVQQRAIVALLSSRSVREAAKTANVAERSLTRWMSEPVFRTFLAGAEADLLDVATRRLLQLQDGAIDTVEAIMRDTEAPVGVRLRAAQIAIDCLLRLRELRNLEQRIVALEWAYANEQNQAAGRA